MSIKLGEICNFQSGGTPSKNNSEFFDGTIPWVTTTALNGSKIDERNAATWITEKAIKESAAKIVPANSIMVGTRVGVGKVAVNTVEMSTSQDIISLIDINEERWDKDYLCKFLQSKSDYLNSQARGATIKGIKINVLAELAVPDISVKEQCRISEVLNTVTKLINARQQQLTKLDELVKARFVEVFGNPLDGTAKYPIHQVGKVAEAVDPQPSHRTPPIEEDGIPYISIKDCDYKTGVIDFQGARRVSTKVLEEHLQRYTLHDGDFVIGKIGTIGQPIFVPSRKDYALSANIVLIQPDSELVSPYFLKYSFESDFVERQFAEAKNSTSQAAFGIQKVRTIEVMDPDLDVQRTFERFTKQIDKLKLSIRKSLEQMEILKKALMQKYFG